MRTVLFPCASCARHIRIDHASCPFCEWVVPDGFGANAVPAQRGRLERIATLTFALTVAGCGGSTEGGPEPSDGGTAGDVAASDASKSDGRVDDEGGISAKYGAPPIFDGGDDDAGSPIAEYGAPPIDGGGSMPLYGLAPPWRD